MKRPTAQRWLVGFRGILRNNTRCVAVEVLVLPVTTEFPEVTVHIIQAPGVGLQVADPVGVVFLLPAFFPPQSMSFDRSSPKEKVVALPARQAYSHCASVGRETALPVFFESLRQKSMASGESTSRVAAAKKRMGIPTSLSFCE